MGIYQVNLRLIQGVTLMLFLWWADKFVKSPVIVLQEVATVSVSAGTTKLKKEETPSQEEEGHQSPLI